MAHSALTLLLVAACLASGAKAEGISKSECNARLISAAADHNTECAGLVTEMLAYSRCGDNCTADALIQAIFSDVGTSRLTLRHASALPRVSRLIQLVGHVQAASVLVPLAQSRFSRWTARCSMFPSTSATATMTSSASATSGSM